MNQSQLITLLDNKRGVISRNSLRLVIRTLNIDYTSCLQLNTINRKIKVLSVFEARSSSSLSESETMSFKYTNHRAEEKRAIEQVNVRADESLKKTIAIQRSKTLN